MNLRLKSDGIYIIIGTRGSGKTTLAKWLIDLLRKYDVKILVYDYLKEYGNLKSNNVEIHYANLHDEKDFDKVLERILKNGNIFFVVEEADKFFNVRENLTGNKSELIHRGRHYGIGGLFITRRIANLNKDVVSQADLIFSFYQFLPNDIEYLREFIGDYVYQLTKLKEHEFMIWNRLTLEGAYKL